MPPHRLPRRLLPKSGARTVAILAAIVLTFAWLGTLWIWTEDSQLARAPRLAVPGQLVANTAISSQPFRPPPERLSVAGLQAQPNAGRWANLSSTLRTAPSQRSEFGMAYDPLLDCVVLFGGRANSNAPLGDTWEFGNGHWTNITSKLTRAPSPRYEPAVAYDPDMRAIVLFGGDGSNGWLSDTWVLKGSWGKE